MTLQPHASGAGGSRSTCPRNHRPPHVALTYDYQLLASEPVNGRVTYEAVSYTATARGWVS